MLRFISPYLRQSRFFSFQFQSLLNRGSQPDSENGYGCSSVLECLKNHVVSLAGGNSNLGAVQDAAQAVLQLAWSILLPTAQERAIALTALLQRDDEYESCKYFSRFIACPKTLSSNIHICFIIGGSRFMVDLLVTSMMADGGLEAAFQACLQSNF